MGCIQVKASIGDRLVKAGLEGSKPCKTPMCTGLKLAKATSDNMYEDPTLYRSMIGAPNYVIISRPDVAYTVSKLSQYMDCSSKEHWVACKHVLRYLKGTQDHGLQFRSGNVMQLVAYTDANWGCDVDDRKSIGGYCIYLGGYLISWSSKKQTVVARSNTEFEYRSLANTRTELTWLTSLLRELKVSLHHTPIIWCDNSGANALASNPIHHGRTKHIEIDVHFIRDKVKNNEIEA